MENKSIKKGKVMPGDELAVIEEFESGKGTYEIKGQIRASVLGETTVDNKKKFIQINKSIKRSLLPKENDQVEGILETEKFLRIQKINGEMSLSFLTIIHYKNISNYSQKILFIPLFPFSRSFC